MLTEINPGILIDNRYHIQKLLGQGSFGRTYLASDTKRFGELCVLKEFVPTNTKKDIVSKSRELFEREARTLYQIQHPQIPKFLAWLTEKDRLFIVQEYIDGKTYSQLLSDRLQQNNPFSEAEVLQWLWNLLPVLGYIHQLNIIHRDISLDNVMFSHNLSKPVLIDFGVVKEKVTQMLSSDAKNPRYSAFGSVVGKIGYSPPEQIRIGHCYPCSDFYALGVCAIVLLTGKMPDLLMDYQSLEWRWLSYVNVSDTLAQTLDKMLAEQPSLRYQSAREIIAELQPLILPGDRAVNQSLKTGIPTIFQEKTETLHYSSAASRNTIISQSAAPVVIASENNLEAAQNIPINPDFLAHCQQELTRFVGPFASVLIKDTLVQTPHLTPTELVEVLATAIPHPQRAKEFRNRVQIPSQPESATKTLLSSTSSQQTNGISPAACSPEFLNRCRQELARFVGPFASVVLEDTLAQFPQITPEQLIDALVAEIPHQQRAQEFRKSIQIPCHS